MEMQETGIIRKIDELGRIVLPIEVRKLFGLKEKDTLEILTHEDGIYLKPIDNERCVFCGVKTDLIPHSGRYICPTCLAKINQQATGTATAQL